MSTARCQGLIGLKAVIKRLIILNVPECATHVLFNVIVRVCNGHIRYTLFRTYVLVSKPKLIPFASII